jgi:hypothetical protein
MKKPEAEWPTKKQFSALPAEERRKDVVTVASALSATAPGIKFKSLKKLINTYVYVFQAIRRWRTYRVDPVRWEQRLGPPPPEAVEAAVLYLIQESQKEINLKDIESLLPEVNVIRDDYGHERRIIMVGGRVKVMFRVGYDALGVPVLLSKCLFTELYLLQAHQIDHGGINSMIMRSREKVWVIQAGKVAAKIKKQLFQMQIVVETLARAENVPPPQVQVGATACVQHHGCGSFWPLQYKDMVRKRVTGKGWGVIFCLHCIFSYPFGADQKL